MCFIAGGGESFTLEQVNVISRVLTPDQCTIIAVNNAFTRLHMADILYFADRRWYAWNREKLAEYKGPRILTRARLTIRDGGPRLNEIKRVNLTHRTSLSDDPGSVAGWCSGSNAVNIAYHHQPRLIVLLGFDAKGVNWHNEHKAKNPAGHYERHIIPSFNRMAAELKAKGVEVVNASPGSAMTCFPIVSFEEALKRV